METTTHLPGDGQVLLWDQHLRHGGCGARGFIRTFPLGCGEGKCHHHLCLLQFPVVLAAIPMEEPFYDLFL